MSPLSIEALATATGLTPERIRQYVASGVLPAPELREGVEVFGTPHLERARLVLQLQAEGMSLDFIARLVEDDHGADQLIELRRRLLAGLHGGGETTTIEALVARFGDFGGRVLDHALRLNLLVGREDGRIDVPSPQLLDVAERAVAAGVTLEAAVEVAGVVRNACVDASGAFLRVVVDQIWAPFEAEGFPPDQVLDVARRIFALRAVAQGVFDATLPGVLVDVFDRAFEDDLDLTRAIGSTVDPSANPADDR